MSKQRLKKKLLDLVTGKPTEEKPILIIVNEGDPIPENSEVRTVIRFSDFNKQEPSKKG